MQPRVLRSSHATLDQFLPCIGVETELTRRGT